MSRSKQKGSRIEREIVELHVELGIKSERVPLSGALGGKYSGDVWIQLGTQLTAEVKARANGEGFATLERWLGENDVLFLRRDKAKPIVALPWRTYEMLLRVVKHVLDTGSAVQIASLLCLPPAPPRTPRVPSKKPARPQRTAKSA